MTDAQYWFGLLMVFSRSKARVGRRAWGSSRVVLVYVEYNLGAPHPGVMGHGYIDLDQFIDIMIYTTDGVMGLPAVTPRRTPHVRPFGTLLYHSRGGDFFNDIATAFTGHRHGGSAKVAVASSALYGMISGSPTADVSRRDQ